MNQTASNHVQPIASSRSSLLLRDEMRIPIERAASAHFKREWRVHDFDDRIDYASHPSAVLSDGPDRIFAKFSGANNGLDQFEVELEGLRFLAKHTGVQTPEPIDLISVECGVLLVMEGIESVDRTPKEWRQIGKALAHIHCIHGKVNGFDRQGYFGPLYQDNRPAADWLTFFTERRLWPRFTSAIESGHLSTDMIRKIEKLIERLPALSIPKTTPTLLHGDAQQNNFISSRRGAVVIDPAIYYGNPEMDLAYIDYFQPVPDEVFAGYQEELPIDPGFLERRDLWRIPGYLAIVTVEGPAFLDRLKNAVEKYL